MNWEWYSESLNNYLEDFDTDDFDEILSVEDITRNYEEPEKQGKYKKGDDLFYRNQECFMTFKNLLLNGL